MLTDKFRSLYAKESESEILETRSHFASHSATLFPWLEGFFPRVQQR